MTRPARSGGALTDVLRTRLYQAIAEVERRAEGSLGGTGLTPPLNHLLEAVVLEPGVTVSQIARRLGKSQQAISQTADRLVRLGLVERQVGQGRSVELHATIEGRALSRDAVALESKNEEEMRQILGADRFDRLLLLLRESRDLLRSEREAETRAD